MLENTSSGAGAFENQLVVDVLFEVPLPQKMILLSVGNREIFSSLTTL